MSHASRHKSRYPRTIPMLFAALMLLSACGQKGPLFRPGDSEFAQAATSQNALPR